MQVDLSPLSACRALEIVNFKGSPAVSNLAPLADLPALRAIDRLRVMDRRAFAHNAETSSSPGTTRRTTPLAG